MLYQAQCNFDGLFAGQLYELTAEDEAHHARSIEAGFLARVTTPFPYSFEPTPVSPEFHEVIQDAVAESEAAHQAPEPTE